MYHFFVISCNFILFKLWYAVCMARLSNYYLNVNINETNKGLVNGYLFRSGVYMFLQSTLGSLMSIYSEAGDYDSVEVSGDIVFSMCYEKHTQSLLVFINECHGLAYGDASRQLSNP